MASRRPSGASAKCSRSDALYIMKRRLMISVVSTMSSAGACDASSCAEATIEAPANTMSDISMATSGGMPLATIATPVMTPKGTMPRSTGRVARAPAAKLLLAAAFPALFPDTGPIVVALLVLARFADALALRRRFLGARLALRGVLALCAQLAPHAIAVLGALAA